MRALLFWTLSNNQRIRLTSLFYLCDDGNAVESPHEGFMKYLKMVLRPGIQLIEYDHPDALFSYYGNPHFQKFVGKSFPMQDFFSFLSTPREVSAVYDKFSSVPNFSKNLALLIEEDFFAEITSTRHLSAQKNPFIHFCSHFHHSFAQSSEVLKICQKRRVQIIDHLNLKKSALEAFSTFGMKNLTVFKSHTEIATKSSDLTIVLSTWQNLHNLQVLNRWFLDKNREYFLVLFDMFGGSVGPLLGRRHGPCFACLQARRDSNLNLGERTYVQRLEKWAAGRSEPMDVGIFPPFADLLLRFTAIEAFKKFANLGESKSQFVMKEVDYLNIRTQHHEILPTPLCPHCFPKDHATV